MKHLRLSLRRGRTWLAMLLALPALCSAAEMHRVALANFTTDENQWESIAAVAELAPVLQAELAHEPAIEWVERAELGLVQKELALGAGYSGGDFMSTVRLARWNKADWLVTGRLVTKDGKREVLLEVIDLAHADVLAERRIELATAGTGWLRAALAQFRLIASGAREALRAAAQREKDVAGLPVIAVLFFPDSEVFQREFAAGLRDAAKSGAALRVLRFPRVAEALGEAELVLGGFAEDREGVWQGIADTYVWGALNRRESGAIDGEEIDDGHTPEITITVWNGRISPLRFVEEGEPVDRSEFDKAVAAQAQRLAASVAEMVNLKRPSARDAAPRQRVSRALSASAEQLEESKVPGEDHLHNPSGRRHFHNLVQTLAAACFFDPQNRVAQEQFIQLRWPAWMESEARNRFRFQLARSAAWGRFAERFGLGEGRLSVHEQITLLMQQRVVDHDKISALMRKGGRPQQSVVDEFLDSACDVAATSVLENREDFGYPVGVPEKVAADWTNEALIEVARRTGMVASRTDVDLLKGLGAALENRGPAQFQLRDPRKRIELIEKVWPELDRRIGSGPSRELVRARDQLRKAIEWTYAEVGNPGEVARLFSAVRAPNATPSVRPAPVPRGVGFPSVQAAAAEYAAARLESEAGQLFWLPPITATLPELKPTIDRPEALAKAGLYRVDDLATFAGRLWMVAEGLEHTDVAPPNSALEDELRPTSYKVTRLFSFDPTNGTVERVQSAREFTPISILPHDGLLWVALGRDGAATFDPTTGALRRFGREDGLSVAAAYRFSAAGGRVFLTTDMSEGCVWDPAAKQWSGWGTQLPAIAGVGLGGGSRRLCGTGPWLALNYRGLRVCDLRSGKWKSFGTLVRQETVDVSMGCVAADGRGFWFGDAFGLHMLDPETGKARNVAPLTDAIQLGKPRTPAEAVDAFLQRRAFFRSGADSLRATPRIPGVITGIICDGDFVWAIVNEGARGPSDVSVFHKPTGRWLGHFKADQTECLAADDKYLWLGGSGSYGGGVKCLQRIEKAELYQIPQERWMDGSLTNSEARSALARLQPRERAMWHFCAGEYAAAAEVLGKMETPTAETLFLQGLCHDSTGLNQPDKARVCFTRIIRDYPGDSLSEETRKQLAALQKSGAAEARNALP